MTPGKGDERSSMAPQACDVHGGRPAVYQCENCLKQLCESCVRQEVHLFFCVHCDHTARRKVIIRDEPVTVKETTDAVSKLIRGIALGFTNHFLVPLYWRGTATLKQIGFFFAMATVLIARYGKIYELRKRQALYTGIMAAVTLAAMARNADGPIGFLAIVVIIFVVWRFATGVTNKLDLVEEEYDPGDQKLYGVDRLHHEEIEQKYTVGNLIVTWKQRQEREKKERLEKEAARKKKRKGIRGIISGYDAHGNPAASVARLAVLAVFAFALGEPILLSGSPEIGQRALVTVMVFMLSTGIVLAAASAAGTYHHTVKSGGKPSLSMLPLKVVLGIFLLVAVLAVGLSMPGVEYRGSGKIKAKSVGKTGKGTVKGKDSQNEMSDGEELKKELDMDQKRGKGEGEQSGKGGGQSPEQSVFNIFAGLGKLLLIPLAIFMIGFILYVLFKIWPFLKGMKLGMGDRFRKWLEKLRAMLKPRKAKDAEETEELPDPSKAMATIQTLQPKEAVLTAYSCLLALLDRAGHKRVPRLTPYEYLATLPERFQVISKFARFITDLYVHTAYGNAEPSANHSKAAIQHLFKVKELLAQ
jgi:hypothetical protein